VYKGHADVEVPIEYFTFNKSLTFFFHDHEFMMDKGLISGKAAPPLPRYCKLNTYTRDQNLRKYFAHRERRGADLFTGKPL